MASPTLQCNNDRGGALRNIGKRAGMLRGAGRQFTRAPEVDHLDLVLTNGYLGQQCARGALPRTAPSRHPDRIPEACRDGNSRGLNSCGLQCSRFDMAADGDPVSLPQTQDG